jgi:hypothetical protein
MMFERENKTFSNTQWLVNSHVGQRAFLSLEAVTRGMLRASDKISLPSIAAPFAWRAMWDVYVRLRDRERSVTSDADRQSDFQRQAADDADWNAYVSNRVVFLEEVRRFGIDDGVAKYLGLEPGDLADPTIHSDNFGTTRHPRWQGRALRISIALGNWQNMSAGQRAEAPRLAQQRSLAQRVRELEREAAEKEREQINNVL